MRYLKQDIPQVVTVRVGEDMLRKLDDLSRQLHRSRAGTIRTLIANATLTGQADLIAVVEHGKGNRHA